MACHDASWLMSPTTTLCIRPARHFVQRLHERLPGAKVTEGELQRSLTRADWYPASGYDRAFYAICRIAAYRVALVVAIEAGLAHLVTVYEPRKGWERRLKGARPWPLQVVLAVSAS